MDIDDDTEQGDNSTTPSAGQGQQSTGDDDDPTRLSALKSFQSNFLFLHPAKPTGLTTREESSLDGDEPSL